VSVKMLLAPSEPALYGDIDMKLMWLGENQ
jgi:hypothetical protein